MDPCSRAVFVAAVMSSVRQRYRDISPVTLQVVGGAVSSSLYCGEVEGLQGGLVEAFLVELYRCKLCQFTCGLKASISSHLLLRHRPPDLPYLSDGGGGVEDREEAGLQRGVSPYQLDLNGESKQSDEDEDFLLYNMLDNMSPPTCDINSEGGLQVAHTCEVSTLFEEDFPLKGGSVDLSCPIDPPSTQEEMAQSAHLKTLGLCRISATKPPSAPPPPLAPPPAPAASPPAPPSTSQPAPPPPDALTSRRREGKKKKKKGASASRPFTCPVCLKTFGSYASRNRHQQSDDGCDPRRHGNHTGQEPSKRRGRLIGQAAWKEAELTDSRQVGSQPSVPEKQKTRIKTTEKEEKKECEEVGLTCSLCHRKFCSKLTLRRHLGVHGGERPFTCQHCDYSSRLKASLLQHLRTHTGEKPYRCPQCPYASIDRSSLLRHSRTHSQERPYRCQHCDYSSIQKKSLDLHARRHHTGEAFPCQQCEYSSPDRQLLLRHVRRHHTPSQHAAL